CRRPDQGAEVKPTQGPYSAGRRVPRKTKSKRSPKGVDAPILSLDQPRATEVRRVIRLEGDDPPRVGTAGIVHRAAEGKGTLRGLEANPSSVIRAVGVPAP